MTRGELVRTLQQARANVMQGHRESLQKSLNINEQKEIDELTLEARALSKALREAFMLGPAGSPCPTCNGSGRI